MILRIWAVAYALGEAVVLVGLGVATAQWLRTRWARQHVPGGPRAVPDGSRERGERVDRSIVESAYTKTVAVRTARFRSANLRGGPTGPIWRTMRALTEGIVDFNSRRAITWKLQRWGGLMGHLFDRPVRPPASVYLLYDGTAFCSWTGEHWDEPWPMFQPGVPRLPQGLSFLDLLSGGSLVHTAELGGETVRGAPATHYALTLDVDHIPWPDPRVNSGKHRLRLVRLINKLAPPKVRQRGLIPAEVWFDEHGRLVRFSFSDLPREHPLHEEMPWTTTELWDFGSPPEIENWKDQPDPTTLQLVARA